MAQIVERLAVTGCSLVVLGMGLLSIPNSTKVQAVVPPQLAQTHSSEAKGQMLPITAQAMIGSQLIQLEVAQTPQQQAMGLMFRTSLSPSRGMLFSFQQPRVVGFWMKNCKISLDMIFLRDGVVQRIEGSAPPCTSEPCPSYSSGVPVDQVIELRGGRAKELGVKAGDRIVIQSVSE
ncbi:MAG: DUF192 domain-containing protein [Microcoleaceae cyanobacterium]